MTPQPVLLVIPHKMIDAYDVFHGQFVVLVADRYMHWRSDWCSWAGPPVRRVNFVHQDVMLQNPDVRLSPETATNM